MVANGVAVDQPHHRFVDWLAGSGLSLAALGLYGLTLAPTVLEADGGEFQFVSWLPGIAHPTGYPLYILLGWLWTHLLPVGEVAWRMNFLSALFAAITVGLTYGLARQLLDITLPSTPRASRIIAALVTAATFAVSHTFWSQAVIAEVYSLHAVFVAAIVWLALNSKGNLQAGASKWLAFTFGLGLTHHRTIILLLPVLALFFWLSHVTSSRSLREKTVAGDSPQFTAETNRVKHGLIYGLLLITPLLLYLYLPLIAPLTPYATLTLSDTQTPTLYQNSWQGFWDHVAGTVFTGELQPTAAGFDRLALTWQLLRQQIGWVGVVLALTGLIVLWQRRRFDLLGLTGLSFLAFVTFNLIYFIGDIFVLFIPAWFFVCLWLGLGSLGLCHWLAASFVRGKITPNPYLTFEQMQTRLGQNIYQFVVISLVTLFLFLPIILFTTRKDQIDQSYNVAAQERWQEILAEPIPAGAILLSNDRNEIMPLWYYQYVEGRRPDLLGLFPLIVPQPAYANVGRVLDQALTSGRPVYLIKPMDDLRLKADLAPAGTLFHAVAYTGPPSYTNNVILPEIVVPSSFPSHLTETIKLLGYDLSPAEVIPGAEVRITLHWQATQALSINYTSYVHLINSDQQGITQSDHQPGGDFYPTSSWQIGETLRDQHLLTIPVYTPPGVYRLRVGMYYQPEPGVLKSMGSGQEIGHLTIQDGGDLLGCLGCSSLVPDGLRSASK